MICRLCLNNIISGISFAGDEDNPNGAKIARIIKKYFDISLDIVSNKICQSCWQQVQDFHVFWLSIEQKQNELRLHNALLMLPDVESLEQRMSLVNDELEMDVKNVALLVQHMSAVELQELDEEEQKLDWNTPHVDKGTWPLCDPLKDETKVENEKELEPKLQVAADVKVNVPLRVKRKYTKKSKDNNTRTEGETLQPCSLRRSQRNPETKEALLPKDAVNAKLDQKTVESNVNKVENPTSGETFENSKLSKIRAKKLENDAYFIENQITLKCCICSVELKSFDTLKKHFRNEHNARGYMPCCKNRYFKRKNYVDHLQWHQNPNMFQCKICGNVLSNSQSYENHMYTAHADEESLKFQCPHCTKRFTHNYIMRMHMRSRHFSPDEKHDCKECNKTFRSVAAYQLHHKHVHLKAFAMICDICGKSFSSKANCNEHKLLVHQGGALPKEQCPICLKWFKNRKVLYRHKYKHKEQTAEYKCEVCGVAKASRTLLGSHRRYHHPKTMQKCTICNKEFKRALSLKEHLATHTGIPLYNCDFCPRTFKSHANMYSHRRKKHPEELASSRKEEESQEMEEN